LDIIHEVLNSDVIAIDSETTGTYWPRDRAFGISVATEWNDYYFDIRQDRRIGALLGDAIRRRRPVICAHNASFDYKMVHSAGLVTPMELWQCTVVRACLINEHESTVFPWSKSRGDYSLDTLASKYLGLRKDQSFYVKAREFFCSPNMSKNIIMSRIAELPYNIVAPYARIDATVCRKLWMWQQQEISEQGLHDIVSFEQKVFPALLKSEMRGVDVDTGRAEKAMGDMTLVIDQAQKQLNTLTGIKDFNVNSGPQVKKLFEPKQREDGEWYANDGTKIGRTPKGGASFKGEVMHEMSHPAAASIIEVRSLIKTRDTFLSNHILGHEINGKVYPNINQSKGEAGGTGTGRLSYTAPALQQIPSRNKTVAAIIKPCFKPPQGKVWLETDLASFEVRVFAHLVAAYNDALVRAYEANPKLDFHQWVGDMTGLPRDATYSGEPNSKQLNLSMIFNQGKGSTAAKMKMAWEWATFTDKKGKIVRYQKAGLEAEAIIAKYHSRVQGVHTLATRAKMLAESRHQIKTAAGRRLRFPNGYKAYKASGILIQSTSADINKRNWLVVEEALGDRGHLMLNTHDSYSMAVDPDWRPEFERVREAIQDTSDMNFRVPLLLDLDGAGRDWWSAKCGEYK
jgi:DNA polymerase I-like protein with 3'-5' exonuclease and polymerase domains